MFTTMINMYPIFIWNDFVYDLENFITNLTTVEITNMITKVKK